MLFYELLVFFFNFIIRVILNGIPRVTVSLENEDIDYIQQLINAPNTIAANKNNQPVNKKWPKCLRNPSDLGRGHQE